MLCLKKGGTTAVRSSFMMPWTMRILMTCRKRQVFFDVGWQMPTNCFAAKQLSQFYKHSKLALHFYVYAPLRSVQNEHPLDVLHLMFGGAQGQKPIRASTNFF